MWSSVSIPLAITACAGVLGAQGPICANQWLPGHGAASVEGTIFDALAWDPDGTGPAPAMLVAAGAFTSIGGVAANNVAALDLATQQWSPLGAGVVNELGALVVTTNGDLVAGGRAAFGSADSVWRWSGSNWVVLPPNPGGSVYELAALPNGGLVAASSLPTTHAPIPSLQLWNGSSWSLLAPGIANSLATLPNGHLIVGSPSSMFAATNVARWDGAAWSSVGAGVPGAVTAVAALANGDIAAGSVVPGGGLVMRWDGAAWSQLGTGTDARVNDLVELANGDLIAAGEFTQAGGAAAQYVARWNGTIWSGFPSGPPVTAHALAALPAGGFLVAGANTQSSYALRWTGAAWLPFAGTTQGTVRATVTMPNGDLVVAGTLSGIGGQAASRLARWNGTTWSGLGGDVDGDVNALLVMPNGDLVAGGAFGMAGSVAANRVARWDGSTWSPFGTGVNGPVRALTCLPNGDVVAAGWFWLAGGTPASHIARWNGTAWFPLGAGLDDQVDALVTLANGDVVAGGRFHTAGPPFTRYVARWNGAVWSPLDMGLDDDVYALAVTDTGELVAGGRFAWAGWTSVGSIARWNGTNWTAIGPAVTGIVQAIAPLPGGDLVIGGWYVNNTTNLSRGTGNQWTPVPGALPGGEVHSLRLAANGDLIVGGGFTSVGGLDSAALARLATTCPANAVVIGTGCAGAGGANVLTPVALPWVGSTYRARATGLVAGSLALEVVGFGPAATPLGALLPQALAGCLLLVTPVILRADVVVSTGVSTQLAIPTSLALVMGTFRHQVVAFELDALGNMLAVTSTNGLQLTIGAY